MVMHTDLHTAFGAGPFSIFVLDKLIDSNFLNVFHVIKSARFVFGSVTFFKAGHEHAWKLLALDAKIHIPMQAKFAILDLAVNTRLCFDWAIYATPRTVFLLPDVCPTETAIQSARSDQIRGSSKCIFHALFETKFSPFIKFWSFKNCFKF